ncbi:MAG TPA: TIGR03985 family CRISPR-associated protein [Cyanobacteria bacterium UBA8803]|nr:TIGR03985 family CRISPR-associated protein [Cyanobacteria bacterium UBA9273]HBL57934.1 TIGR03985 family CRISPR-associated protein [Cyanobacteria bacterium UBA8803]
MAELKEARPQVEFLQWLARGSLKQNLLRAIRLWVWLHSLYGDERDRVWLNDPFTYAEWRDAFFSPTHPKGEAIPNLHDPNCACAKTTAEWIFQPRTGVLEPEWRSTLQQHNAIFHDTLISGQPLDALLHSRTLAVTRRSLLTDLQILAEQGWLQRQNQHYQRVSTLPNFPTSGSSDSIYTKPNLDGLPPLNLDLNEIAQNLSQPIGGFRRFFLGVDYIISSTNQDRVEDWQHQLKHLWQQTPVPPVKLIYHSAKLGVSVNCIVYPICIYYMQRAVYLCTVGQDPEQKREGYNFRLDKIEQIVPLDWNNPDIPTSLRQRYPHHLPTPDDIEVEINQNAWGFDFYLPSCLLLLRFERNFHDRYIKDTFRHETFEPIPYQKLQQLIQKYAPKPHQQTLLTILKSRSPQDAYYKAWYREGDTNIGLRLRAWRPKGEVIMPWELRQEIAREVAEEFKNYH